MWIVDLFQRLRAPVVLPEDCGILMLARKHRECFNFDVESFAADCFGGGEPEFAFESILDTLYAAQIALTAEDRVLIQRIGEDLGLAESEWNIWDYEMATLAEELKTLPRETDEDREIIRKLEELAHTLDPTTCSLS